MIGIDLGTTNSCVAVVEGGKPVVIPKDVYKRQGVAVTSGSGVAVASASLLAGASVASGSGVAVSAGTTTGTV